MGARNSVPRRWRPWLQLAILGVAVSVVATVITDLVWLSQIPSTVSTDGGVTFHPRTGLEPLDLANSGVVAICLAPFTVLPTLIFTRLIVGRLCGMPLSLRLLNGGSAGALLGISLSLGTWFLFGGWGPPLILTFTFTGAALGIGWAWASRGVANASVKPQENVGRKVPDSRKREGADLYSSAELTEAKEFFAGP
jgi:hypothetical protein